MTLLSTAEPFEWSTQCGHRTQAQSRRARVPFAALACGLLLVLGSVARPAAEEGLITPEADGRLSVRAPDVPLPELLAEVGRVAGISVRWTSAGETAGAERVTAALDSLPLGDVLRHLLRDRNYALIFTGSRLTEIWVLSGGHTGPDPPRGATPGRRQPRSRAVDTAPSPDDEATSPARVAQLVQDTLGTATAAGRERALSLLTEHADFPTQRDAALAVLHQESDPQVRGKAYELLEEPDVELERLLELPSIERDPGLRIRALELIDARGKNDPRVASFLRDVAGRDPALRETVQHLLRQRKTLE